MINRDQDEKTKLLLKEAKREAMLLGDWGGKMKRRRQFIQEEKKAISDLLQRGKRKTENFINRRRC